jgi:hypothetical protein
MKPAIVTALLLVCGTASAQQSHPCAVPALKQARALLLFHHGADVNLGIDESVKVMPPLRNPADSKQWLEVLEVNGYVYRTTYRMRLIYKRPLSGCVLMGQEVLESSSR